MKQYLIVKRQSTGITNKLHRAIEELLCKQDRHVVTLEYLDGFVNDLNSKIAEINKQHPRCQPAKGFCISQWDREDAIKKRIADIHLSITNGNASFMYSLYQIVE